MATVNIKTIGTGGDYATVELWFAACPANLTTADPTGYIYRGKVLNTLSQANVHVNFTGISGCDSTHYCELTTGDGVSFLDNANVQTNALRYNTANGVGLESSGAYQNVIRGNLPYLRINKLQLRQTNTASGARATVLLESGSANSDINQCIIEGNNYNVSTPGVINCYGTVKVRNSLVVKRGTSAATKIADLSNGASAYNSTFVSIGSTATAGVTGSYGTCTLSNVFVGGCTSVTSGSTTFNKTTCFTDVSGPPAGWSSAPLGTSTFESVTDGSHDFRLKAGSVLIDAGTTDSTYAANDITGLARSGSWDVGAWETSSAGGTTHAATGALSAQSATLSGTASRSGSVVTHAATGALIAQSAALSGSVAKLVSGTFVSDIMTNNIGTVQASIAVVWEWRKGTGIGVAPTSVTYGTGTTSAAGVLTVTGLPSGYGELLFASTDRSVVAYQQGTVV